MQHPTLNLNGTNGKSLFDALYAAYRAVDTAHMALREATPHGRDYPDWDTWKIALAEHVTLSRKLTEVSQTLLDRAMNIDAQMSEMAFRTAPRSAETVVHAPNEAAKEPS